MSERDLLALRLQSLESLESVSESSEARSEWSSVSSNSGLDIPETSNKDNFSKPFPLKPETRKSETIRNSHLGQLEASDNHSIRDEHNIKESDNVYESDQKQGEMLSTVPILQDICGKTEDIPSNPQSSKKVTKMDKKVLNEKVRKYFHFLFI